jgi:hypothetical protein
LWPHRLYCTLCDLIAVECSEELAMESRPTVRIQTDAYIFLQSRFELSCRSNYLRSGLSSHPRQKLETVAAKRCGGTDSVQTGGFDSAQSKLSPCCLPKTVDWDRI